VPDHFEGAKDDILKRTAKNGGPTPLDLLNAIEAADLDADDRAKVLRKEVEANRIINAGQHADILSRLDIHVLKSEPTLALIEVKLTEMEKKSTDIAGGFKRIMETDEFQAYMDERATMVDDKIAAHYDDNVREIPEVTADMADLMLTWKRFRWFIIIVVGALVVMLADQLGNMLFGGMT